MQRLFPYLLVTTAGGAVMALELVGSRLLSPYFGGTTVIWTALIGIIMACLAAGYWWGGQLADRRPDYRVLAAILAGAGGYVAAIALGKEWVLSGVASSFTDIRLGACAAAIVLFGPPSFLLAAVGPFVIRMQLRDVADAGSTIGKLNAASTGGSIVGTFLAGFVLLAWVGHFKILIGLASLLLAAAAACAFPPAGGAGVAAAALLLGGAGLQWLEAPRPLGAIVDVDSHYARLQIAEGIEAGRPTRAIFSDIYGAQAAIFLDRDDDIVYEIQRFFRLAHHFRPDAERVLVIGGGVGVVGRDFLSRLPRARVDMVEIDPAYVELGRRYFNLRDDPRLRIFHEDGRTFVRRSKERYDAIVVDAFANAGSVPYQLTTEEFVAELYAHLNPGGVVVLNLASAIEGERALFLHAEAATYARFFDETLLFQVNPLTPPEQPQSLTLVALRKPAGAGPSPLHSSNAELESYLARRWTRPLPEHSTLTDDFAPVDYYFARAIY